MLSRSARTHLYFRSSSHDCSIFYLLCGRLYFIQFDFDSYLTIPSLIYRYSAYSFSSIYLSIYSFDYLFIYLHIYFLLCHAILGF